MRGRASAGKKGAPCLALAQRPVHPRVCGEHAIEGHDGLAYGGSSPRLRGTRATAELCAIGARFIPASAGNTRKKVSSRITRSVHPHVCGEHAQGIDKTMTPSGSSPRLRGTQVHRGSRRAQRRFIPASAGNTLVGIIQHWQSAVHPRVCGEHITGIGFNSGKGGSSPRLRGTPLAEPLSGASSRFIPASAGNTFCHDARSSVCAVHPRVCGEHPRIDVAAQPLHGSSPRLRGTRLAKEADRIANRFIPASAGNTLPRSN